MFTQAKSLFNDIPVTAIPAELIHTLTESSSVRIERIVSDGQSTPAGEWYDQAWHEWVLLVSGEARLLFDDGTTPVTMKPGDHILIQAHCRHRVEYTATDQKTIWVAVHFGGKNLLDPPN